MKTADYLTTYATELADRIEQTFTPIHLRGDYSFQLPALKRDPLGGQLDAIHAIAKTFKAGQKTVNVIGEMGCGKAQPLNATVLTPQGFVTMGSLRVGDKIVDPDGGIAEVIGVYPQGVKKIVRVWFNDGSSTECCQEHLWAYQTPLDKWKGKKELRVEPIATIRKNLHTTVTHSGGNKNRRCSIPIAAPANLGSAELPIDPYVMGLLIGDGTFVGGTTDLTTADEEIAEMAAAVAPVGVKLNACSTGSYRYRFKAERRGVNNPIRDSLRELGLMGRKSERKFVPTPYLLTSVSNRIALLQGLLDTDGGVEGVSAVSFVTVSRELHQQVAWLVRSLGGIAKQYVKRSPKFKHKGESRVGLMAFVTRINLPQDIVPFRLTRKRLAAARRSRKYEPCRMIDRVEDIGEAECQCISVSSKRSLYVTDDFIVTHNTMVAIAAMHTHAAGKPYRALVMCPPHLTEKWVREVVGTVPRARARIVERYRDLVALATYRSNPVAPEFFIVSESMAKLGTPWRPACVKRSSQETYIDMKGQTRAIESYVLHCPCCNAEIKRQGDDEEFEFLTIEELAKRRMNCEAMVENPDGTQRPCGSPLWSWTHEYDRWPIASYLSQRMRGLFDYAVLDEVHEMCGSESAIAIAMSKIVQVVKHVLPLTGTYLNGYAHSIEHLLWRSSPETLSLLGFSYGESTAFAKLYGRLQKTVKSKVEATSNKESRGTGGRTTVKVLPGIMPSLFGDHLLNKSVFINLEDITKDLPNLSTDVQGVDMDDEQAEAYAELEDAMPEAIEVAMRDKDMSLLTQLVQAMMGYTDFPYKYGEIGYQGFLEWQTLIEPRDLDPNVIRPKEQALVDFVMGEAAEGRQTWVFCEMTQKRDVQPKLAGILKENGLRVKVLKSQTVPTKKRDAWIAQNAPGVDVIISHPGLVETGFDLFDKKGTYNFPSLIFYQTGLMLSTLRQASRRSWRIGQPYDCKVRYLYYRGTMQQRFIDLMAAKLQASEAIDGKFSTEGLSSLADAGESMGIALAKSLLDSLNRRRAVAGVSS